MNLRIQAVVVALLPRQKAWAGPILQLLTSERTKTDIPSELICILPVKAASPFGRRSIRSCYLWPDNLLCCVKTKIVLDGTFLILYDNDGFDNKIKPRMLYSIQQSLINITWDKERK